MTTDDTAPTERDYEDAAEIATIAWRIYGWAEKPNGKSFR